MVREISHSASQAYLDRTQKHVAPAAEVEKEAGNAKTDTRDELDLSSQSRLPDPLEKGPFWQLLGVESENGWVRIEDVRSAYNEQFAEFTGVVKSRLGEAGVDLSCEFTLRSDSTGLPVVAGAPPDKQTIETLVRNDPVLANQFRGMNAAASFLHAIDEAAPFHKAYAKDPYAAVQRHSQLFDDNQPSIFNIHFDEEGAETLFTNV